MAISKITSSGLAGDKYNVMTAGNNYYEPLASTTLSSSNLISFTNIPQNYAHLQLRVFARTTSANVVDGTYIQCNGDTGTNYSFHYLNGNGTTVSSSNGISGNGGYLFSIAGANATGGVFGAQIIDILYYANTAKYKNIRALGGVDNNGSGTITLGSVLWQSTAAITSITLYGLYLAYGSGTTIALYGVK